jgi:integrase
MNRPGPKVSVWELQERPERRSPYIVRWKLDSLPVFSKAFQYKGQADDYRATLVTASRRWSQWNYKTGEPIGFSVEEKVDVAEWCRTWLLSKWVRRSPHTRRSYAETLTLMVEHSATRAAPKLTDEQRKALRAWLLPEWDQDSSTWVEGPAATGSLKRWLDRYSPSVAAMDQTALWKLDARMRLRADGARPLASTTETRHVNVMRSCFEDAVAAGLAFECVWPDAPKGGATLKSDMDDEDAIVGKVPSTEQMELVLEQFRSRRYRAMSAVGAWAGLRPSETLALTVGSLTLPDAGWGSIAVTKAWDACGVDFAQPGYQLGKVKTLRSKRVVPIPPLLVAELKAWIEHAELTGSTTPLFRTAGGKRPGESNWSRSLKLACSKAGCEELSPYGLRHTYGSWCSKANLSIAETAARMGHSDPSVTLRYYTKQVSGDEEEANRLLDGLFG